MTRWSLDVTGEKGRAHLLSSVAARCGHALDSDRCLPIAHVAWSRTQADSVRDVCAVVRRHLWGHEMFSTSPTDPDAVVVPHAPLQRWFVAVCSCIEHVQR
jgi:hypothetical protein